MKEEYKNNEIKLNEFREKINKEKEELTKQLYDINDKVSKLSKTKENLEKEIPQQTELKKKT